jgi:UDP-galactopyranose mutase
VEFSGQFSYEFMCSEVTKLPGNLKPLAWNYEPNSYIVHDQKSKELISEARAILKAQNVHLLGRFAEWEYYNMDKAIEAGMALYEEIG